MSALYKAYTSVLAERLSEELEVKGVVLHNRTEFKKGTETVDNIYILNYMIGR